MSNDRQPRQNADVCVVGAGVAGGLVAYSLAKQGYDVVILEAGPWLSMDSTSRFDRMEKFLRPDRDAAWSAGVEPERGFYTASLPPNISNFWSSRRVKAVGGTTLHWSAGCYRFHEKDFNMESRYDLATDWPINYADLRPYYAKAEAELGVAHRDDNPFVPRKEPTPMDGHPQTTTDRLFEEACEQLGIRTHGLPVAINTEVYDGRSQCLGFSTCRACPSGAKYSGDIHIRKAEEHGARVIDQAQVLELNHDSSGEYIESAAYITPDGTTYRQTADQFVLCCGGIEIPRLLLLSSSKEYPSGLANSSGAVGKYFFSTPEISTTAQIDADLEPARVNFGIDFTRRRGAWSHNSAAVGST